MVERDRGDLQIVYGIDGRCDLDEQVLEHLHGYQGARPVRIGNAAYQQKQHDVWGVVLDSLYLHTKSRDRLDDRVWQLARQPGGARAGALARARPRHLGGPRRAAGTSPRRS